MKLHNVCRWWLRSSLQLLLPCSFPSWWWCVLVSHLDHRWNMAGRPQEWVVAAAQKAKKKSSWKPKRNPFIMPKPEPHTASLRGSHEVGKTFCATVHTGPYDLGKLLWMESPKTSAGATVMCYSTLLQYSSYNSATVKYATVLRPDFSSLFCPNYVLVFSMATTCPSNRYNSI